MQNQSTNTSDVSTWVDIAIQTIPWIIAGFRKLVIKFKWRGISKKARDVALAIHYYSWINLKNTPQAIKTIGNIERKEISEIETFWDSSDLPVVLTGEAGSGKSGVALRLGRKLALQGIPVLFITATDFPEDSDPVPFLQNRLAIDSPLIDSLQKLSIERSFVMIIDQLDSVAGTDLCKNLVSLLKSIAGIPKISILAVSRSYDLEHDISISSVDFQRIIVNEFSDEQAVEFLTEINILNPSQELIKLSKNTLNLSLIADIASYSHYTLSNLTSEVDLWENYFQSVVKREGEDVSEFLLSIAKEKTIEKQRIFDIDFPSNNIKRKLLSRGVILQNSYRKYEFRHEKLRYFLYTYSLLPEELTLSQLINKVDTSEVKDVIKWMHALYHKNNPVIEPKFINDVLNATSEELPFYTRTGVLDNLRQISSLSNESVGVLVNHLDNVSYQQYFFDNLFNPNWVSLFFEAGLFNLSPEPLEITPGSYQLPDWPAIKYLIRFAPQYEAIFVAITKKTFTKNRRIQAQLIEGMRKISPETASTCTFIIDAWLDSPFSKMLPNDLIPLTDRFIDSSFVPFAIQITDFVLKPVLKRTKSSFSSFDPPYGFRSDPYWVNEFCNKVIPRLMKIDPQMLLTVFQEHLEKALTLTQEIGIEDFEEKLGYYWRMDIAFRSSSRSDGNITDILVDGLRDSLSSLCEVSPERGEEKVAEFLHNDHLIFQRIAIHTLRKFGSNYLGLLEETISHWEFADKDEYKSEYRGLLRDQYANVSDEIKAKIIENILGGPSEIERRTLQIAGWKNHEPTEDDRVEAKERWMQFYFELIKDKLPEQQRQALEEFNVKYGATDVEEKPKISFSAWTTAESPITLEDLAAKGLVNTKQYFLEYKPENEVLNSRESLARTFQSLVSKDPTKYLDFATLLIDPTIRFVYTYNFLFGIREAIRNNGAKLTNDILSLCEFVISQEKDPYENPPDLHEAGLFTAQLEVAHLLNDTVQSDDPYLSSEQLYRIRKLLLDLAHHINPSKEDDERNEMSPFDHAINCVRGEAMHGLINYSLYHVRQKQNINKDKKWFIEEEIIEILNEKIDYEKEPSPAIRSVIGSYLTQIYFMSKEWTTTKIDVIFPPTEIFEQYWRAAWSGYLIGSNINKELFNCLISQYQRGLRKLNQPKDNSINDPSERLAQHVMVAYLNDMTDFGDENHILDLFYENAPDGLRAQAIFWLSKVLENEKPAIDSPLWLKCWSLWKNRFEYAEKQEPVQNGQEISDYMRWLEYCPLSLDVLFPMLFNSIKYFQDSYDVMQITKYAAKYCELSPVEAITLLHNCITTAKELWWNPEEEVERNILTVALKSKNGEAKGIAIDLINYHGEKGDYRWKDLLE